MEILELKMTKIKNSVDGFNSRMREESLNKWNKKSQENIERPPNGKFKT